MVENTICWVTGMKIKLTRQQQSSVEILSGGQTYKPKYFSTLILAAVVVFFYILLRLVKQNISLGELAVCLVVFIILVGVELVGFARGVTFEPESMKLSNGFQYIFHLTPKDIFYREIKEINEMETPRRKFSNLKIVTSNKVYMIPITGISHYEEMKAESKSYLSREG